VTYHPVTLSEDGAVATLTNLLGALDDFPAAHVVITYPNSDTGGRLILERLQQYAQMHSDRVLLVSSLGQLRYLSMMSVCDIVIGNSSSGLIEAPSFHVPTINIGSRQKGRILPATVLQCGEKRSDIRKSINMALAPEFKKQCKAAKNPYGDGFVAKKIINRIKRQKIDSLTHKHFFDIACADHE
jgi:UDP-N-acetylglucosamine 2-epimerase (non-hydrolysing)/GDP/UDP-N,N'-diacetylbacillosamine 2-epimerase (hydrolysing)